MNNSDAQSRRNREREEHRQIVLMAAERVFARNGIADTTMEAIAAEAQYSVGSIYNFFVGKEELFKQILLRVARLRAETVASMDATLFDHADTGLRCLVRAWISHCRQHLDFMHIVHAYAKRTAGGGFTLLEHGDPVEAEWSKSNQCYRDGMELAFRRLVACGEVRHLPPDVMLMAFEGYIHTSLFRARHRSKDGVVDWRELENTTYSALLLLFSK